MPGLYTEQRIGSNEVFAGIGEGPVTHQVTAANSAQANQCGAGAIRQTHRVAGANSQQANTAGAGSVTQSTTTFVAGSSSQQANQGSAGAVRQVHLVRGANSQQINAGSTGAIRLPGTANLSAEDVDAIVSAVVGKLLGARSLGAHIQAIAASAVGETTGAGTSHMTFVDGPVTVEADVPLPGETGDRTNVVISGV